MDASWMITAFVVIDTLLERLEHHTDVRAQVPDCEIVTIAVVSAKYEYIYLYEYKTVSAVTQGWRASFSSTLLSGHIRA